MTVSLFVIGRGDIKAVANI